MTYTVKQDVVSWKGKRIAGADAASFSSPLPIVGCDAHRVYVVGKPAALDRTSFQVLSPCYLRDRHNVYQVMDSKLKPLSGADAASFEAIGVAHGRDAGAAWFRDKKMRLAKGGTLAAFRELAPAFATDGRTLYFGTQQEKVPARLSVDWTTARLKAFGDSEINCPLLAVDDGTQVLVRHTVWHQDSYWMVLPGAMFDSLVQLEAPTHSWNAGYLRDAHHVWYLDQQLTGVSPKNAHLIGTRTLVCGRQVYSGAHLTTLRADALQFVAVGEHADDLFHTGQQLLALKPGEDVCVLATRKGPALDAQAAAAVAMAQVFRILFTVFDTFLPIQTSPYKVLGRLGLKPDAHTEDGAEQAPVPLLAMPTYRIQLAPGGILFLTRADGSKMAEQASGWYTLACRFWAAERGRDEQFLPYPALGHMLPSGDELLSDVLRACAGDMLCLAGGLFDSGATEEARVLAHQLLVGANVCEALGDPLAQERLCALPRELVSELHFQNFYYHFDVTTNLAVARYIIANNLLADPDWRMRLLMAGKIHAVMDNTNQEALFYQEVMPTVMARFDVEPFVAVRERLAMAVEMALVHGQVGGEVHQEFHYDLLLPMVNFCLQRGINTRFNRARLAETLWALDRADEGDAVAGALLSEVGELAPVQAIYADRYAYRCHRIWFLEAKTRIAWRRGTPEVLRARATALEDAYASLLERFGEAAATQWDEMRALQVDIARYRGHVGAL